MLGLLAASLSRAVTESAGGGEQEPSKPKDQLKMNEPSNDADSKIAANVDYPTTNEEQQPSNVGNGDQQAQSSNALSNDLHGSTQFVNLDTKEQQESHPSPDASNTTSASESDEFKGDKNK